MKLFVPKNPKNCNIVESFIKGAEAAGNDVVRFDTAFMDVHPCIAFVTPIYYYGLCAQLKTVIDRFYAIERKIRNGQKTVFISAMADDRPETVIPANDSYKAIVNWETALNNI